MTYRNSGIKSVQRGTVIATNKKTITVTINNVGNKASVRLLGTICDPPQSKSDRGRCFLSLTDPQTLTVIFENSDKSFTHYVSWEVKEYY